MFMVKKETLDKLLGSLVFNPIGLKYKLIEKRTPNEYEAPFDIIIYFDPERYHAEGNNFDEEYTTYVYEIEDRINDALRYLGSDGFDIMDSIFYKPTSDDVYKRVKDKIIDAMPEVTKEFNKISGRYLPKLGDVQVVYDYNPNILRDYIDFNFTNSGIPDFDTNSKYIILFFKLLKQYVNLDSFVNNINKDSNKSNISYGDLSRTSFL